MSNTQVNNRLLDVLVKLLAHHVQSEKANRASLPQTDDAFWELEKQAQHEFLAKQSPIDWETTPWQYAISFLSKVSLIKATEYDLRVHIAASKIGLDELDEISVELVRLDREGVTDKLLSVIQDEFPGEWIDLNLPVPSDVEGYNTPLKELSSGLVQYVTLEQISAIVNRSKRTLEKWKTRTNNPLPPPDIEGCGGKPDEWIWPKVRIWLEANTDHQLPEVFPDHRFNRS